MLSKPVDFRLSPFSDTAPQLIVSNDSEEVNFLSPSLQQQQKKTFYHSPMISKQRCTGMDTLCILDQQRALLEFPMNETNLNF